MSEIPAPGQIVYYLDAGGEFQRCVIDAIGDREFGFLDLTETESGIFRKNIPHVASCRRFRRFWCYSFQLDRARQTADLRAGNSASD